MRLRPALTAPVLVLVLAGCSEAQDAVSGARDTAGKVQDCAGLARDVLSTGLDGVPTQAEVEAAKTRLDGRIDEIGDTSVREAANGLSGALDELLAALRTADRAQVEQEVREARDAATAAAEACDVPVGQFLG